MNRAKLVRLSGLFIAVLVFGGLALHVPNPPSISSAGTLRAQSTPPQIVSWAGGGDSAVDLNFHPNYVLTLVFNNAIPSGSLLVVFLQAGWDKACSVLTPTPASSFTTRQFISWAAPNSKLTNGTGFPPIYCASAGIWTAAAGPATSSIQMAYTGTPANTQMYLYAYAAVYSNAAGIGNVAYKNGTYTKTQYIPFTVSGTNSTVAFFGFEAMNSVTNGCGTGGVIAIKQGGMMSSISIIVANTSLGMPQPYGYYDLCAPWPYIGIRGFDTGTLSSAGTSYIYTLNDFTLGNNWFYQFLEVQAPLITTTPWQNPPANASTPGFYSWLPPLVFVAGCLMMIGAVVGVGIKFIEDF